MRITRWEVVIDAGGRGRWRAGEGRGWGDGLPSHLDASRDQVYRCTEPLGVCRCRSAGLTGVFLRMAERQGYVCLASRESPGWSVLVSWYKSARSWTSAASDLTGRRAQGVVTRLHPEKHTLTIGLHAKTRSFSKTCYRCLVNPVTKVKAIRGQLASLRTASRGTPD